MDKNCCDVRGWSTTPLCKFQKCTCDKCNECQNNDDDDDPCQSNNVANKNQSRDRSHRQSNKRNCKEDAKRTKQNSLPDNKDESPNYQNDPSTLSTIMFDIIGALAFFIMATSVFWMTAGFYLKAMILKLYHADRRTKIIVWCAIAVCTLGIAVHAYINLRHNRTSNEESLTHSMAAAKTVRHQATMTTTTSVNGNNGSKPSSKSNGFRNSKACKFFCPKLKAKSTMKTHPKVGKRPHADQHNASASMCKQPDKLSAQVNASNVKSTLKDSANDQVNLEGDWKNQTRSMCDLLADGNVCDSTDSNSCVPLSEEDGLKMYNRYRWYCIPLEMKTPPALLVFIKDYFTNC